MQPFVRRPGASLVLALLSLVMSAIFAGHVLPPSLKYGPWHDGFMAGLCLGLVAFFGGCAWKGWRR